MKFERKVAESINQLFIGMKLVYEMEECWAYAMLNAQRPTTLGENFKQRDVAKMRMQIKLIFCEKGDRQHSIIVNICDTGVKWRGDGSVESVDLNGKILEMKISTDMA